MFMDEKGRLWGKISVLDLLIGAGGIFLLSVLYFGGTILRSQHLVIYQVLPNPVIPGDGTPISVIGTGLLNGCKVRLGFLPEEPGQFVNEALTRVAVPEDLAPGSYTVQVRDNRGRFAQLTDGLRVRWNPHIERFGPQRTYQSEWLEIYGHYFDTQILVRLGNIPLHPLDWKNKQHMLVKIEADKPIPPGVYDLTVSNPGGGSETVQHAIEILPRPKVTRVYPDVMTYGEEVILTIEGDNLPRDAVFYFNEGSSRLGDVIWISPHEVKIPFKVTSRLNDWYSLGLETPSVPRVVVSPRVVCILENMPMALLVNLEVNGVSPETMQILQQMPEFRLFKQIKKGESQGNVSLPGLWFALLGQYKLSPDGTFQMFLYHGKLLSVGEEVSISVFGHTLTGRLLRPPIPIRTDDEWRKLVTHGDS